MNGRDLVLGLDVYGHSAAACLMDRDGAVVAAFQKERATRKKHDGGDVTEAVEAVLAEAGVGPGALALAAANSHLVRVDRFEAALPLEVALGAWRPAFLSDANLLPGVEKHVLTHHLAHAWSVLPFLPWEDGLIVVMDGMGQLLTDWESAGERFHSDRDLPRAPDFVEVRSAAGPVHGWREAESVYVFSGETLRLRFKRWTPVPLPEFVHNHGFHEMESLGAVYSRVASQVFGDWNACGKVMGLAPWDAAWNPERTPQPLLRGPLEELFVDRERLAGHPLGGWEDAALRPAHAALAADLQASLEEVVLEFLSRLRRTTGARNVALCGGVALNCVLNGRIAHEAGFERVFVPPHPGDEGVAVGCAAFARRRLAPDAPRPAHPLRPFLGPRPDPAATEADLAAFEPWLEVGASLDEDALLDAVADALADGAVVGMWRGRSEFGPRALGHRSILADPRDPDVVDRLNEVVKKRERFRPFAPVVLAEEADAWFEGVVPSPWMSFVARARERARERAPAVVHVDGTARLQTLPAADAPEHPAGCRRLRGLVERFRDRTGVPMLVNTSFNLRGEPIVETAGDALWTFLRTRMDLLVLDDRLVRTRPLPDLGDDALRPVADRPFSAETVTDDGGEVLDVRLLHRGRTVDADPLAVALLEAADGEEALGDLVAFFAREWELDPDEVRAVVARLWEDRLLHFGR